MSDPAHAPEPESPKPRSDSPPHDAPPPAVIDQEGRPAPGGNPDPAGSSPRSEAPAGRPAGDESERSHHERPPPPPPEPPVRRSAAGPVLGVLGFLVLAGGIGYVWYQQQQFQQNQPDTAGQMQALQQQVQSLKQQVSQLQAQPAAKVPADLGALSRRVAALEQQKTPDLSGIKSQLDTLEQRQPADLGPLKNDIKGLQTQIANLSQLPKQITGLAQQVQQTATQSQQATSALTQRLDTDESRLVTLEHNATQISHLAERSTRLARLQAAQMALAQGHPLGDIPDAPSALARYATEAPPTEASLRLSFPQAEQAAYDASSPDTAHKPFLSRVLANAEGLVTVRRGDHVLVGNATAGILARAHAALEAGDLAGAVADLSDLSGPPAQAVQPWLQRAKALLAARNALAQMVAKA